jgi:hypothetical protein
LSTSNCNIGQIICESESFTGKATIISTEKNRVIAEGTIQDVDAKNRNGRFYAGSELFPELKSVRTVELINTGNMYGEAGHPIDTNLARQQTIDPKLIAPKFLKIWPDGKLVKAQFKGAQTQYGQAFNDIICDETLVSFSLRALGTVENTTRGAEVKNLKIITWDWVIFPSHKTAYMDKIITETALLNESTSYSQESGLIYAGDNAMPNRIIMSESSDSSIIIPINNQQIIDYIKDKSYNVNMIKESFDILYDSIIPLEEGRKVQMSDKFGHVFIINTESYIQNEIMNYCSKIR